MKEWKCAVCGFFESDLPVCVKCGDTENIKRVFLTAPGFKSDKTKFTDENLDVLAKQSGMTDYSNNLSTRHEKSTADIWKPYDKKNLNQELATIQASGVDLKTIPTTIPISEKTYHKDDKDAPSQGAAA